MSDLYSRKSAYDDYIDSGMDPQTAQLQAGLSDLELGAMGLEADPEAAVSEHMKSGLVAQDLEDYGYVPIGFNEEQAGMKFVEEVGPEDPFDTLNAMLADETGGDSWWVSGAKAAGRATMAGFQGVVQSVVFPHQLLTHMLAEEDWRTAVPGYLRPEEWANNPELDYKYISFLKALDSSQDFSDFVITDEDINRIMGEGSVVSAVSPPVIPGGMPTIGLTGRGAMLTAFHTADMVVDMMTDPATYAANAGIFSRMHNLFRRIGPVPAKAQALAKIAAKSGQVDDLVAARAMQDKLQDWLFNRANRGKFNPEQTARLFKKIDETKAFLDSELKLRIGGSGDDILANQVPLNRPENITIPKKGTATKSRIRIAEQRKQALTDYPTSTRPKPKFEDVDEQLQRAITGPDQAEHAAETAGAVIAGADPLDDVLVHTNMPINGTKTSTNLPAPDIDGVGANGRFMASTERVKKVVKEFEDAQDAMLNHIDDMTKELDDIPNGLKAAEQLTDPAEKKAAIAALKNGKKTLAKDIKDLDKQLKEISDNIKYVRETGTLKGTAADYGVKWPSGPRRELTDAGDFATSQFGDKWYQVSARTLYPKSIVMRPKALMVFDRWFRESWRVLDQHAPLVGQRIQGGLRDADVTVQRYTHAMANVFHDAGIYGPKMKGGVIDASGVGGVVRDLTLDKKKNKLFFQLLDDIPDVEREILEQSATKEMLEAVPKAKAIMDEAAQTLGLNPGEKISTYITHMVDKNFFNEGYTPYLFQGTSVNQFLPGILKTRVANKSLYKQDAAAAFDYYFKSLAHEVHVRPLIQEVRLGIKEAINNSPHPETMGWLNGYGESINERLLGKPTLARKVLKSLEGSPFSIPWARPAAATLSLASYSSVLSGSTRYFVMSTVQAINSTTPGYGALNTLGGMAKMMTPEGRLMGKITGSTDEVERMFDGFEGMASKIVSRARTPMPSIQDAESFIRGTTMHASISAQLQKMGARSLGELPPNMANEVVAMALRDTRDMNHVFGWMGKPLWFSKGSRTGSTLLTQFTLFPFKQTETIFNNSLKNPGYLLDYIMYAGWQSKMAEHLGVNLDDYIGVPDFRNPVDEGMSIPMNWITASIKYGSSILPSTPPVTRRERKKEWLDASESMIPFFTAHERGQNMIKALKGEEIPILDNEGHLVRKREMSIANGFASSEQVAVMIHMPSVIDRIERKKMDAIRKRANEAAGKQMELADEFRRAAQAGEPPDRALITKLAVELNKLGVEITLENLFQRYGNAVSAQEIPAIMRLMQSNKLNIHPAQEAERKERTR